MPTTTHANTEITVSEPNEVSEPTDPNIVTGKRIRKPGRVARSIASGEGTATYAEDFWERAYAHTAQVSELDPYDPRTPTEAKRRPDWNEWLNAMHDEIKRLESRHSWDIVEHPGPGINIVDSKWVYRLKKDARGNIVGYRARLVARGFTQIEGVDYEFDDTFAPICKFVSIRTLLAIAAMNGWVVHQMDVKSAYLYGKLSDDEVIYMRPPTHVQLKGLRPGNVLRLRVAIYGLKQSGRCWYATFLNALVSIGLKRSEHDHALFYRHHDKRISSYLASHVDDLTLIAPDDRSMETFKRRVKAKFECTDSGELHWILGIEAKRDRPSRTISLSQTAYIDSIIARYGFQNDKPVVMPMDPNAKLSKDQCASTVEDQQFMKDKPYSEALGAAQYLAVATRPDIAYACSQLAQFLQNPGPAHWRALRRLYQYLKFTRDLSLVLGGTPQRIVGYSDADGMSSESRKPISGYVYFVNGGAVSWSSKRQPLVTLSTTEAEYVGLTHATKEAIWLRSLVFELFPNAKAEPDPVLLYSDNQSAIALAKDDRYHAHTKHIDIRFHFI